MGLRARGLRLDRFIRQPELVTLGLDDSPICAADNGTARVDRSNANPDGSNAKRVATISIVRSSWLEEEGPPRASEPPRAATVGESKGAEAAAGSCWLDIAAAPNKSAVPAAASAPAGWRALRVP